jgi:hypothetical protein
MKGIRQMNYYFYFLQAAGLTFWQVNMVGATGDQRFQAGWAFPMNLLRSLAFYNKNFGIA